jgi:hypothetical protein
MLQGISSVTLLSSKDKQELAGVAKTRGLESSPFKFQLKSSNQRYDLKLSIT